MSRPFRCSLYRALLKAKKKKKCNCKEGGGGEASFLYLLQPQLLKIQNTGISIAGDF